MLKIVAIVFVLAVGLFVQTEAARLVKIGGTASNVNWVKTKPPPRRKLSEDTEICHLGCFRDTFAYRAVKRKIGSSSTMTVESCLAKTLSSPSNYKLFSLQYGKECWTSKGLPRAKSFGVSTDCNMTCSGNPSQTCGGWLAVDLYTIGKCPTPAPSPAPSPPTDYEITMVLSRSQGSFCNATKGALYDLVQASQAMNRTSVRCSNSTGSKGDPTIQVNVRFNEVQDLNNIVDMALDMNSGQAAALHTASNQGCVSESEGSIMYMLVTNSTKIPGSTVVYDFACPKADDPAVSDGPKKWTYIVSSPFMCCDRY